MFLDSVQEVSSQIRLLKADLNKLGRSVKVLEVRDTNGDGFLTLDELRDHHQFYDKLDTNQDGLVSMNEIIRAMLTNPPESISKFTYQESEEIANEITATFRTGNEDRFNSQSKDMLTLLNQTELTQNIRHGWLENLVNDKDLSVLA
jgi:hypothetical protein